MSFRVSLGYQGVIQGFVRGFIEALGCHLGFKACIVVFLLSTSFAPLTAQAVVIS